MLKQTLDLFTIFTLTFLMIVLSAVVSVDLAVANDKGIDNEYCWPEKLNLEQLPAHDPVSNPYGDDFDYAKAFGSIDLKTLKDDI